MMLVPMLSRLGRCAPLPLVGRGWGWGSSCEAPSPTYLLPPSLTLPHKSLRPGARKRGPGGGGNRSSMPLGIESKLGGRA